MVVDIGNPNLIPKLNIEFDRLRFSKISNYKPSIIDRLNILYYAFASGIYDFKSFLQYIVIKHTLVVKLFSNKTILIEEAMDLKQQFVLATLNSISRIIISQRGPIYCGRYLYEKPILVDNSITMREFKKYNKKVEIVYEPYLINSSAVVANYKNEIRKIGYIADLGDSLLNRTDKINLDNFIVDWVSDRNYSLSVSVHPQELANHSKFEYYRLKFQKNKIKIREKNLLEDFFNDVDVVIGWYSTTLFQAFYVKKPVIILDLFADYPMRSFVENSEGLMQYACNSEELEKKIHEFNRITNDDFTKKHNKALVNMGIKYVGMDIEFHIQNQSVQTNAILL